MPVQFVTLTPHSTVANSSSQPWGWTGGLVVRNSASKSSPFALYWSWWKPVASPHRESSIVISHQRSSSILIDPYHPPPPPPPPPPHHHHHHHVIIMTTPKNSCIANLFCRSLSQDPQPLSGSLYGRGSAMSCIQPRDPRDGVRWKHVFHFFIVSFEHVFLRICKEVRQILHQVTTSDFSLEAMNSLWTS